MAKRTATPVITPVTDFELFEEPEDELQLAAKRKEFRAVANVLLRHMSKEHFQSALASRVQRVWEWHIQHNVQIITADLYLRAVHQIELPCDKPECVDGLYRGKDTCYRCVGKGYQTAEDLRRNWGYDQFSI